MKIKKCVVCNKDFNGYGLMEYCSKTCRESVLDKKIIEKKLAWQGVAKAMKNGLLNKPEKCEKCGANRKLSGHHKNYSEALNVVWVCRSCHVKIHNLKISV